MKKKLLLFSFVLIGIVISRITHQGQKLPEIKPAPPTPIKVESPKPIVLSEPTQTLVKEPIEAKPSLYSKLIIPHLHVKKKDQDKIKIRELGVVESKIHRTPSGKVVHVQITKPLKKSVTSFHAFIDPESGKILETWGHPVWEKKHPLRDLRFSVQ